MPIFHNGFGKVQLAFDPGHWEVNGKAMGSLDAQPEQEMNAMLVYGKTQNISKCRSGGCSTRMSSKYILM